MAVLNQQEHKSQEDDKAHVGRANRPIRGERRVVTILFCDVKGSTNMASKLDPEDWAEIMNEAFEYLIRPIYRYEGTVSRLMGDAVLAFFGAPTAHEDDPQRAVLAGLDILKDIRPFCEEILKENGLDFGIRIGIHTGTVVVGDIGFDMAMEYTAMGDAANVAARMEETAAPGTIQISESTYKLVAPIFQIEPLGNIEVKGKSEPIKTYRVIDVKAEPSRLHGIQGLQAPLIGRSTEIGIMKRALSDLHQGQGGIITIIGEAGMGKSRLIDEVNEIWQSQTGDQQHWFSCRGVSYDTSQPYGLFQQLLRKMSGVEEHDAPPLIAEKMEMFLQQIPTEQREQAGPVVESLLTAGKNSEIANMDGETFKRELYRALTNVWQFSTQEGPAIYVFDDLHWADSASIELLLHLCKLVDHIPILFLCAIRPDRQSPGWQVKVHAETHYPHHYQEILLSPLHTMESQELIHELVRISDLPSDLQELILQKAEGNPFFVEEVIRSLFDQGILFHGEDGIHRDKTKDLNRIFIPDNLQALLTARIDRLTTDVRSTLQYAAVIGRTFYNRILKCVSDEEEEIDDHLNILQGVDLIYETSRVPEIEYMFRHELTRDAAYQTILRRERKRFHRRVGEALESAFPERKDELSPRLAYHFDQAGEYDKALTYYIAAGDIAAKLYANKEAIAQYTRAIELTRTIDVSHEDRIHLYAQLGRTLEVTNQYDEALKYYQELEAYGIEHHNQKIELAGIMSQATLHSTPTGKWDFTQGKALSLRGLELAEGLQDPRSKAKVLWNLMLLSYFSPDELNSKYGEEAITIAREHNTKEELAYILHDQARTYTALNQFDKANQLLSEAQNLWRELGNLPMLADNLTLSAYLKFEAGQYESSINLAQDALEISRSIENIWGQSYSSSMEGLPLFEIGKISEGIQAITIGEQFADEASFVGTKILNPSILCWVYVSLGDLVHGNKMLHSAIDDSEKFSLFQGPVQQFAAWVKFRQGDTAAANKLMSKALSIKSIDYPDVFVRTLLTNLQTEIALASDNLEKALSLVNENLNFLDDGERNHLRPDVLRLKAKVLMQMGRWEEGQRILQDAKKVAENITSRRSLIFILGDLLDIAKQKGNKSEIEILQVQGKEIASFISDHIVDPDSKQSFNNLEEVRNFYS